MFAWLRRLIAIGLRLIGGLALLLSLSGWVALSLWLPTRGKAWLIDTLQRQAPIQVTLDSLAYRPFQGFLVHEMRILGREDHALWATIPAMEARVNWFLLLDRRVSFRLRASLERPCQTDVVLVGTYHLRDGSLEVDGNSAAIPVRGISAPLNRWLPPTLHNGLLRLTAHLRRAAGGATPSLTGAIEGIRLVFSSPGWKAVGNVTLTGAVLSPHEGVPASFEGEAALEHGTFEGRSPEPVEGLPSVWTLMEVAGTGHLHRDRLEVTSLTGHGLGVPWRAEGTVFLQPAVSLEAHVSVQNDVAHLAHVFPAIAGAWEPRGTTQLDASCRGGGQPWWVDCLGRAELWDGALAGPKLIQPVTGITGRVWYDALTHVLTVERLRAFLQREDPLALSGTVGLAVPLRLALHAEGALPLASVMPWLPPDGPIAEMEGLGTVSLDIGGSSAAPSYAGTARIREGRLRLSKPTLSLEHVGGTIRVARDRIALETVTLTLLGEPLTMEAVLEQGERLRLSASLDQQRGQLVAAGRFTPNDVVIENAALSLPASRVQVRGTVGRTAPFPSHLDGSGTIELTELSRLPFLPLPALETWKLRGPVEVQVAFDGPAAAWREAMLQGRLRALQMTVRDVPIEQFNGEFSNQGRRVILRVPAAVVCGGRFEGEWLQAPEPSGSEEFSLTADLTGLSLDRLVQALPSLKDRAATGTVSSHLMLSGTVGERRRWRGEGWFSASGNRLSDLPLLGPVSQRGVFQPLAEWLKLDLLQRAVITQASCHWRLAEEQITTDDVRLAGVTGKAGVVIYAKGRVGLDHTIRFKIEPQLSEPVIRESQTVGSLVDLLGSATLLDQLPKLFGFELVGTLEDPKPAFRFTPQELIKSVLGNSARNVLKGVFNQLFPSSGP